MTIAPSPWTSARRHWRVLLRAVILACCVEAERRLPLSRRAHTYSARWARDLATTVSRAGGGYLKVSQILSTRRDLLPSHVRLPLEALCDHAAPSPQELQDAAFEMARHHPTLIVDETPLACGAIALVFRASIAGDARSLVVKQRRSGAREAIFTDLRCARLAGRFLDLLPMRSPMSFCAVLSEIESALLAQLDFAREREMQVHFARELEGRFGIRIPQVDCGMSTDSSIVMEEILGCRIDDEGLDPSVREKALTEAVRLLFEMLLTEGWVHCDLHPGNLLVMPDGRLTIIDFGLSAKLTGASREALTNILLALATCDAARAVESVLLLVDGDVDVVNVALLEAELFDEISAVHGAPASEFSIGLFIRSLYGIMNRHRLRSTPDLVMAFIALVSIEGLIDSYLPEFDFQREAMPFLIV